MTSSIDYWPLAASLQTSKINWIREDFAEKIWEVILQSNNLDPTKTSEASMSNSKLRDFASAIEGASESEKMEFIITITYLIDKKLLNPKKVNSLRIVSWMINVDADKKLKRMIEDLKNCISDENHRTELDKFVSKTLIDSLKEKQTAEELKQQKDELEKEYEYMRSDLLAIHPLYDKAEEFSRSRFAYRNKRRIAYNIHKIIENKKWLSKEEVTRRVLRMADGYAYRWTPRRKRGLFYGSKHMDINAQYKKVSQKLIERIPNAKDKEQIAIRQIMNDINKAHDDYIHEISDEQKKENLFKINSAIANAA